ncbi:MAG: hypothetical protein AAGA77_15765 [Bacteroidota bacterium]
MELRWLFISVVLFLFSKVTSQSFQDCSDPFPICDLRTFYFDHMHGVGDYQDHLPDIRCISKHQFKETNSKWLYFEVQKSGILTFIIESLNDEDPLDVVLFEMKEDCANLEEVSCVASAQDLIFKRNEYSDYADSIGITYNLLDEFKRGGCTNCGNNHFKFLTVEEEEKYILLVNNNHSGNGFTITFDGDCKLRK